MSQYPPPPPSYGAYDQPPPPGFGYPPNQGPYYPQPGYPPQPTTCPPAPGGYYPGQPATQTIEKEDTTDSSSPKEKKQLVQTTSTSSASVHEDNYLPVASEHDNNNTEAAALAENSGKHKYIESEKCEENDKSTALDCGVSQKHNASEPDSANYKPLASTYCVDSRKPIAPKAVAEMYDELPPKYEDIYQTSNATGGNGEKYKPIPLKWVDRSQKHIFPEIHGQKYERLTPKGAYMEDEGTMSELGDKHKQNASEKKFRSSTLDENHGKVKATAPELDYDGVPKKGVPNKDNENYESFSLRDDPEKIKPSAPELDDARPLAATNIDKYEVSSYPAANYQRQKEKPLSRSNEMHNLAVVGVEDLNSQPLSIYNNNARSFNFTNTSIPVITTQPTPYNRFGQSDGTDCCNDACCSGDCGGDDCCKDDCCSGDCGGDDCCSGDCGGDDCCKDDCCNEDCCKDCCTDEQVIELCCQCLCVCIFALIESSANKK